MPSNQSPIRIEPGDKLALWFCLAAWVVSFFLPTTTGDRFWSKDELGIGALITSVIVFWIPIYGWVWPVNIFMALAPVFARKIEKGKGGGAYVLWLCAWALFPLALPICQFIGYTPGVVNLKIGYYVWQMSLLGTATWFLWITTRRQGVLIGAGVVTILFGIGAGVVAPAFIVRQHLRNSINDVDKAIAKVEQGREPVSMVYVNANVDHGVEFWHASKQDLDLATTFMQDIYACHQRDRISDLEIIDRYPEIPVHPAEPQHGAPARSKPPNSPSCISDDSAIEPWISYGDLRSAALERAKLYLRNTKIDLWMMRGQRQEPQQLGSAELPLSAQPVWKEVPLHFTSMEGLVIRKEAESSREGEVDRNAELHKGDLVILGTHSSATIGFADGTTCTLGPASYLSIRENATAGAGRMTMRVLLDYGNLVIDTPARVWRSSTKIETFGMYTIDVGPASSVEVETRANGFEVLLKKGSGQILSGTNSPRILIENEKFAVH